VASAWLIPLLPINKIFGFVYPKPTFYLILIPIVLGYMFLVERAKEWFYSRYID